MKYLMLICALLIGCTPVVALPVGETTVILHQVVQEEYCDYNGQPAYGTWSVYKTNKDVDLHVICISKQSLDIQETLDHEYKHMNRYINGLDPCFEGHPQKGCGNK